MAENVFDLAAFGARLKAALRSAGLSYRDAEPIIGVDHATLYRVASAQKPPNLEHYLRICRWLELANVPPASGGRE